MCVCVCARKPGIQLTFLKSKNLDESICDFVLLIPYVFMILALGMSLHIMAQMLECQLSHGLLWYVCACTLFLCPI